MPEKTVAKIKLELNLIDELFASYADLLARVQTKEPDIVEKTALASVLHSFYNGIEHIFEIVAKEVDQQVNVGTANY
ncbi:MAG: hypothetical protein KDE47_20765 [Caldilineaceae bacterium]|nr:hypothetical protein [Caldilineaceae bacterium]